MKWSILMLFFLYKVQFLVGQISRFRSFWKKGERGQDVLVVGYINLRLIGCWLCQLKADWLLAIVWEFSLEGSQNQQEIKICSQFSV